MRGESITLVKAKKDPMDMRLHFLVNSKTKKRYEGPTVDTPVIATLKIVPEDKFPSMNSLREVYGHVVRINNHELKTKFTSRNSTGFSYDIADYLLNKFSHNQ